MFLKVSFVDCVLLFFVYKDIILLIVVLVVGVVVVVVLDFFLISMNGIWLLLFFEIWDFCDFFLLRVGVIFVNCIVFFRFFCIIVFGSLLGVMVENIVWVECFIFVNWFCKLFFRNLGFLFLFYKFLIKFILVVEGDGGGNLGMGFCCMFGRGFERCFLIFILVVGFDSIIFFFNKCFDIESGFDLCWILFLGVFSCGGNGNGIGIDVFVLEEEMRLVEFLIDCSFFGFK